MVERDTALSAGAEREARLRAAYEDGVDAVRFLLSQKEEMHAARVSFLEAEIIRLRTPSDTPAPASGTGTREVTCQAWAPVNDSEGLIDNESVGRSESQASRSFLRGWPGGWPQASAAGWRLSRVTITAIRALASREPGREGE